ncbi:MAG: Gfo/Idh/MocA family oxidoreductase [Candidatus Hydrogenedentes bacterium]|nr:Gfo/Idh/MocA family oxidoreductase [Candidatus Hydrogenedentota bacterium]
MSGVGTDRSVSPLRAAVLGAGQISAEHMRFLQRSSRAQFAAVCDLSNALARYSADRFGAEHAYTEHARMLEEIKPDVVHVLTPPHTHVALAAECLKAGAHVIVEKPVAPTNAEFRALWTQAQQCGRVLVEDHNYRFNQQALAIETLVNDGALGDIREVEVRMALPITEPGGAFSDTNLPNPCHRLPAGALHDFLPHLCYLALRFLPNVETVKAAWRKQSDHPLFTYDSCDALVVGGGVHARLRFSSHQSPDCFALIVRGSRGWVETDFFQPYFRLNIPRSGGKQLTPLVNQFVNGAGLMKASLRGFMNKIRRITPLEGLQTFLDRTYTALQTDAPPPVTYEDMDRTTSLIDALVAEENRI